jgi:hypothetical protein
MLDEKQIEELKTKYGKITTVIIPLDEDDETKALTFYCRKPDKQTRKMISKLAAGEIPERAIIAGFKALRVAGDEVSELEKNDDAMVSAEDALIELLKVQKATIKKKLEE